MLQEVSIQSIVCWGPQRDCFIVKDTNEFSKIVLPRIFSHSNFASFVRQLNKYGFHKVKQADFNQTSCTFRHQYFHGDRPEELQNIKRKSISAKPPAGSANMEIEVNLLREENQDMKGRIGNLEKNHETMQSELNGMESAMTLRHGQMQGLINLMGCMSIESITSISLALAQSYSKSTLTPMSMLTPSSVGAGPTENTFPDQYQNYLPTMHNYPSNPGLKTLEMRPRPQHGQGDQFAARKVDSDTGRFSEDVDVQNIVGFQSTDSVSTPGSIPVFSRVDQATLLQMRELSQRTAADPSSRSGERRPNSGAKTQSEMDLGEGGLDTVSGWSEGSSNHYSSSQSEREVERGRAERQTKQCAGNSDGADIDAQPLPWAVPIETSGSWSFDTAPLATRGILHGLGIGGLSHTFEPQYQS